MSKMESITVGKLQLFKRPDGTLALKHPKATIPIDAKAFERWLMRQLRDTFS
jgi:hypothetical protein